MSRKRQTVTQLANEASIDIDEALIAFWDAGFDNIIGPMSVFRRSEVKHARRILGVATHRQLKSVAYWMSVLDLYETEFRSLLRNLSIPIGENAKRLPPQAISRLKAEARKRGIDPLTGSVTKLDIHGKVKELPSFNWRTPGHERELRWLNEDEVRGIHFELVNDFSSSSDPIEPPGLRSEQLLASAVFRPKTALGETLKYPTVETCAAALLHSIIQDHPFHNGNKRTALVSTLVLLDENGFFPDFHQDEVFKLVLQVAQHGIVDPHPQDLADREVLAIADWLCDHCRVLEKGDRPISFRKLRHILMKLGCRLNVTSGSKINIIRTVKADHIFSKTKTLHTQVLYVDDGRDVTRNTIKKIRKDLQLDDLHGIDSQAFYIKGPLGATDFIARYRKTLRRLAKF